MPLLRLSLATITSMVDQFLTTDGEYMHVRCSRWPQLLPQILTLGAATILSACGGGGSSSSPTIAAPQASVTIQVSPSSVALNGNATLAWSSTGVSSCSASGAWSGSEPTSSSATSNSASGAVVSQPVAGTFQYTLSCSGSTGSASATATLTVAPTMQQRVAAAQATANNASADSSCGTISQNQSGSDDGFYWEIGDQNGIILDSVSGMQAAGSVQPAGVTGTNYSRATSMLIASASKWLSGSYYSELLATQANGQWQLPAPYVPFMNFTSGYDNMTENCPGITTPTVQDCLDNQNGLGASAVPNGTRTPADVGHFYYNSGHLEVFEAGADPAASGAINGGSDNDAALAAALKAAFSARNVMLNLSFFSPVMAGGVDTTAADYAEFLKGLIRSSSPLIMANFLRPTASDPYAVCTNPSDPACVDVNGQPLSRYAPVPSTISWHYSITHWIEDDPATGDGAYSSPGKFGFYPWVDSSKTYYGILARYDNNPVLTPQNAPYYKSAICGANIRKAFMLGTQQN
jgi:hypothetical protein